MRKYPMQVIGSVPEFVEVDANERATSGHGGRLSSSGVTLGLVLLSVRVPVLD